MSILAIHARWAKALKSELKSALGLFSKGFYRDEETNELKHFDGQYRNLFDEPEKSKSDTRAT